MNVFADPDVVDAEQFSGEDMKLGWNEVEERRNPDHVQTAKESRLSKKVPRISPKTSSTHLHPPHHVQPSPPLPRHLISTPHARRNASPSDL